MVMPLRRSQPRWLGIAGVLFVLVVGVDVRRHDVAAQSPASTPPVMPRDDKEKALLLPPDYREWVLAGSSLGLSYTTGDGHEMFHETLIEPTAYRHFVETGTFREGTMLVLILHGIGQQVPPSRQGRFASDVHGIEMAVKDRSRVPEGWAYYNFGGTGAPRSSAQPNPKERCYSCHVEHAARDNVFLQYYTLLADAARVKGPTPSTPR